MLALFLSNAVCGPRTCWVSPVGSGASRDPDPCLFLSLNGGRESNSLVLTGKDLVLVGERSKTIGSSALIPLDLPLLFGVDFHFLTRDLAGGGFDASKALRNVSSDLANSIGCEDGCVGMVSSGGGCVVAGGLDRLNRGNTFVGLADKQVHEISQLRVNAYDSQPSDCFVPATLVVVGCGSSSKTASGTNPGSGTGAGVAGAEEVTSITGAAGCGGSWVSVVCGSAGLRFLANASAIVGCEDAAI